jgi:hypothetical protein
MRKILFCLLLLGLCNVSWSQTDESIDTQEINKSFEDAMQEFQRAMDTMDLSQIFNQDFSQMFGDSTMQSFDFSQIEGMFGEMDMNEFFGPDMQLQMEQSLKMLEGMDMSQLNSLLEGIDMSQLEGMFKELDMGELEKMFEGIELPEELQETPAEDKSKKMKKI